MNKQPLISILMPIFNASAFLHEALESVMRQTYTNFELLVVDDGSTDDSVAIVKCFKDERIRVISNLHDFIVSLNIGINESTGKYIARMDADDIMLPHRLQTQFDFMEAHPDIDICGSYAASFGDMNGIMQRPTDHAEIISTMLLMNPLLHSTVMIRRSVFLQSGCRYHSGYPCAEDYKLWTDLSLKGFKFANIPEPLIRYRISPQQVTRTSADEMRNSSVRIGLEYAQGVMEQMIEKEERYSEFLDALIELYNNGLTGHDSLRQILYSVYRDFLYGQST